MDYYYALLTDPAAWVALAALIAMEIVLGIDNLVFISILTNKLPVTQQKKARQIGISLALIMRLGLLGTLAFIVHLVEPVFTVFGQSFSWRDLILIVGGLFLVWKATKEIHHSVDKKHEPDLFDAPTKTGLTAAIGQILLLDLVFSVDSIITAVGMTPHHDRHDADCGRIWRSCTKRLCVFGNGVFCGCREPQHAVSKRGQEESLT